MEEGEQLAKREVWFAAKRCLWLIRPPSASEFGISGCKVNRGVRAVVLLLFDMPTLPTQAGIRNSRILRAGVCALPSLRAKIASELTYPG